MEDSGTTLVDPPHKTPDPETLTLLAEIIASQCPVIDLFIGVAHKRYPNEVAEISLPLVQKLGQKMTDICCVDCLRTGDWDWKILTTHGTACVESDHRGFFSRVEIWQGASRPLENRGRHELECLRNSLLGGMLLSAKSEFAYPTIHGNVVLSGSFDIISPAIVVALQEIFRQNGAESVIFVTPVIPSSSCRVLEEKNCRIVRLHPPMTLGERTA